MKNKNLILFIILSIIDGYLTYIGLFKISVLEANPVMKAFIFQFSYFGIVVSKLVGLSIVCIIEFIDFEKFYKNIFYFLINIGLILVIINNIILIYR